MIRVRLEIESPLLRAGLRSLLASVDEIRFADDLTTGDEEADVVITSASLDSFLDRSRGEAVTADLVAGEARLLQQEDVDTLGGQIGGGGRASWPGPDDDDVGGLSRLVSRSGGHFRPRCAAAPPGRLL